MTMRTAALYSNHARVEAMAATEDAHTVRLVTAAFELSPGQWMVTSCDLLTKEVVMVGFRYMEC